jgi:hypothetical protein
MNWHEVFDEDRFPSAEDIRVFLGEAKTIWDDLTVYIEKTYQTKPQIAYSGCSAQPGWNVKYRKSSKSLCTLYPMQNYFIALVVVGTKEEAEVEETIGAGEFTAYLKELYQKTAFSAMGRWLMIEVRDREVLDDVKRLIEIRVKPAKPK